MMRPLHLPIRTFLICFLFSGACVNHELPAYTCDQEVSYTADVHPIVTTRCAISECHNGDLGADRNWLDFDEFQDRASAGLVKNYVINRIMPPSGAQALSQAEIDAIVCWADQGAQEN